MRSSFSSCADPERGAEVVEAVVVAEANVLEPGAVVAAALVAQALEQAPVLLGVGDDDAALAGGHLLVRIEGEDRRHAVTAYRLALVLGAERLAGVVDQRQPVLVGDLLDRLELAGIAEDVDRQDRLRPGRDRRFDAAGSMFQLAGSMSAKTGVAPS